MSKLRKRLGTLGAALAIMVLGAMPAMAQEAPGIGDIIGDTASEVQSTILEVLPNVLGVAGFLLVIGVAWRFFRRFVR